MGVYKNTEIRKKCTGELANNYAKRVAANTTTSDCLLGQSLAKLVAI